MYLRFTQRTNADGTVVRYVALAHNRRMNGQTKPDVLMNLGRVDRLDVDGLRRLAASITGHFGDGDGLGDGAEAGLAAGAAPAGGGGRRGGRGGAGGAGGGAGGGGPPPRQVGATWLLDGLWRRLDVGAAV